MQFTSKIKLIKNYIKNRNIDDENLRLIRNSDYFDEKFYRKKFLKGERVDPAWHYLNVGWKKNFDPSPYFSSNLYLVYHPDVRKACLCPLLHFELYGKKELPCRRISGVYNISYGVTAKFYNRPFPNEEKLKQLRLIEKKKITKHEESIDIIICVHNALEDVKVCLSSVLRYTSDPFRIILVDDNSDKTTHEFLESFVFQHRNAVLLNNNTENHGYGYSVNIGLRYSTAKYIVLLNSDTIVTKNWVDKMVDCSNSDDNIGIVGPLSNTSSWQSVPKIFGDDGDWCRNELPEGMSVDYFAELIEENSSCIYPKVPLLNGFCMLIKRFVIDKIGYIDEENFGEGFGEEDDFNCRAKKAGIDLAICDNTYIWHSQSKSYTDERRLKLCEKSGKKLKEKHGAEYISQACYFMQNDPVLCSIRRRTQMYIDSDLYIKKGMSKFANKKIAFLLPCGGRGGGANVVIYEAKCMQRMGVDVTIINLKALKKSFNKAYTNLDIPVIYLKSYSEIVDISEKYDVICCTHNTTVKYCDLKKIKTHAFPKIAYYIQDYEPYFYKRDSKSYKEAKLSYTINENCINFTKTTWTKNKVEENTGAQCKCIGPSLEIGKFYPNYKNGKSNKLVVTAMLRPATKYRGPMITMEVLRALKERFNDILDVKIFGCVPEKDFIAAEFFNRIDYNFDFTNYGVIDSEHISALLSETDIFLDLSTFQAMGLTAMEAMASGCATIVPANCGTADFVKNEINALMIDTTNLDEIISASSRLINDKQLREKLAKNACVDMCNFYPEKAAYNILNTIFN